MAAVRLIAHLPGVVLAEQDVSLAGGVIRSFSFADWQSLDSSFSDSSASFERTRPVFWDVQLSFEHPCSANPISSAHQAACTAIHTLHRAFLIGPDQPWLPTPLLSVFYLQMAFPTAGGEEAQPVTLRFFGPMEREWMVFGSEIRVTYNRDALADIEYLWQKLRAIDAETEVQRTAWSTLERTARPDSWWWANWRQSPNEFLQCIASCESLLLGDNDNSEGKIDRFSALAANLDRATGRVSTDLRRHWSDIYRLRTALIHGRIGLESLRPEQAAMLSEPRRLLALTIRTHLNTPES